MVSTECEISAHYSPGNLLARLNAALIDEIFYSPFNP